MNFDSRMFLGWLLMLLIFIAKVSGLEDQPYNEDPSTGGSLEQPRIHDSVENLALHGVDEKTLKAGKHHDDVHMDKSLGIAAPAHRPVPLLYIFFYTTLMALASGIGAVPFFIFGRLQKYWAGIANAVAVGVMLSASFDLLHEGAPYSPMLTITGFVIGGLFIKASQDYLATFEDASFEDLQGADARKAMLIIAVMAAHAFGEGSGVGVSFSGERGWAQGLLVTIAIGVHNIPEGMAVAGVMMSRGSTPSKALYWTLICSFPQALVAVPSYLFVETFSALLPVALGFAAGCMVWIAIAELLPDAIEAADHGHVATATTFSAAWLQGMSMTIAALEGPGGTLTSPFQASSAALIPHLLAFFPAAVIAPCLMSAVFSHLLPSVPVSLGAASGAMGWIGAATLVQLLWRSSTPGHGGMVTIGLSAAIGTGLAMLVWASLAEGGKGSKEDEGMAQDRLLPRQSSGGHIEGVPAKHTGRNVNVYSSPGIISPSGSVADSSPRSAFQRLNLLEAGYVTPPPRSSEGRWIAEVSGLPQYQGEGRLHQGGSRGSPLFAACLLVTHGIPAGLAVACAVASSPSSPSSHVTLPLSIASLPVGLACAGVGRALSGAGWRSALTVAFSFGTMLMMTVFICLAGIPLGKEKGPLNLEAAAWYPSISAAVSGALILGSARHIWPLAKEYRARRARAGQVLALIVGLAVTMLCAFMCTFTLYCL